MTLRGRIGKVSAVNEARRTMSATSLQLAKYIGSLFSAITAGYEGLLESQLAGYGANMQALMHDLSLSSAFAGTVLIPGASDRDMAADFVNRLVGDAAAPADKAWAVDYLAGLRASGATWGDAIYIAVSALDGAAGSPVWGRAAAQLQARAAYADAATQGWASTLTDVGTMRDAFDYAATKAFASSPITPITRLNGAASALAAGTAALGGHAAGENYTIGAADTGKAVLLGAGNDTVTVGYGDIYKPAFVSGGDGTDTLVITNAASDISAFMNTYGGVLADMPYRGFEQVHFVGAVPLVMQNWDGVKELAFGAGTLSFATTLASLDSGTVLDITAAAGSNTVHVSELPPYNTTQLLGSAASSGAGQLLDSLTVNVTVQAGSLAMDGLNVRDLTWNVSGASGPAVSMPTTQTNLEDLVYRNTTGGESTINLDAPNLSTVNMSGTTGSVLLHLFDNTNTAHPGAVTITPPAGVLGLYASTPVAAAGTSFNFAAPLKAGSYVSVYENGAQVTQGQTKVTFNSDFSDLAHFQNNAPFLTQPANGSVFGIGFAHEADVYFQGQAAAGQTIGTVLLESSKVDAVVKLDGSAGVDLKLGSNSYAGGMASYVHGVVAFIDNGSGQELSAIRSSVNTQLTGPGQYGNAANSSIVPAGYDPTLHDYTIAGGHILYADNPTGAGYGTLSTNDFVLVETSDAQLAQLNIALVGLGFAPIVDPFLH
jgi:hypothetical protein